MDVLSPYAALLPDGCTLFVFIGAALFMVETYGYSHMIAQKMAVIQRNDFEWRNGVFCSLSQQVFPPFPEAVSQHATLFGL